MAFWLALLLSQEPAVVYRGARLHTLEGAPVERGLLVVRGRIIEAVGGEVPDGARVVDLSGKVVIPGLIDAASRAFLDPADRGPGAPEQDAADALDFFRPDARALAARGVTAAYVGASTPGLGTVVHLGATPVVLKRRAALQLSLARGGEVSTSALRLEAFRQLEQLFEGAKLHKEALEKHARERKAYEAKKAAGEKDLKEPGPAPRDAGKDVLISALEGALPVRIEAQTADAVALALRLAETFKLKLVLEGVAEAADAAEAVGRSKAAVVAGPVLLYGPPGAELLRHSTSGAAALAKAGVMTLALGSFGRDAGASRFILEAAGIAASRGLEPGRALEAVTLGAARALGVEAELGSLKKGKRADFVVLSGEPFEARTRVERVVVDGLPVYERGEGP